MPPSPVDSDAEALATAGAVLAAAQALHAAQLDAENTYILEMVGLFGGDVALLAAVAAFESKLGAVFLYVTAALVLAAAARAGFALASRPESNLGPDPESIYANMTRSPAATGLLELAAILSKYRDDNAKVPVDASYSGALLRR